MKSERMLGIVTYLLRHGQATAGQLAERFEVSVRTILRDVDDICAAGIPLNTARGSGGGITISEGYRITDSVLTESEMRDVLAGVKALDGILTHKRLETLRDKLPKQESDWIRIDLSHGADLVERVKEAILDRRALRIRYEYDKGESERVIEPAQLVYKWGGWYLIAYCRLREDFRLFRLSRIRAAEDAGTHFALRSIPEGMLDPDPNEPPMRMTALYDASLRYRLAEEGAENIERTADGRLRAEMSFAGDRQCLAWAMSLGDLIEVTEPESIRCRIVQQAAGILEKYR